MVRQDLGEFISDCHKIFERQNQKYNFEPLVVKKLWEFGYDPENAMRNYDNFYDSDIFLDTSSKRKDTDSIIRNTIIVSVLISIISIFGFIVSFFLPGDVFPGPIFWFVVGSISFASYLATWTV